MKNLYQALARLIPKRYKERLKALLDYAGIDEEVDVWVGCRLFIALLFTLPAFLIPFTLFKYFGWIDISTLITIPANMFILLLAFSLALITFLFVLLAFYLHLLYIVEDRIARVEKILPDFLTLLAANLQGGMTPFSAFCASSRAEFGPLNEEVRIAVSKSLGTKSFKSALEELSKRVNSPLLKKTVTFFIRGMSSGGHLAKLLSTAAVEIRETQELKKELVSTTKMYSIFILFVVVFVIPLLLAVSIQFLELLIKLKAEAALSTEITRIGFLTIETLIYPHFVANLSYLILIGSGISISLLIGVIREGKILHGLKYIPGIVILSVSTFLLFKFAVERLLSFLG